MPSYFSRKASMVFNRPSGWRSSDRYYRRTRAVKANAEPFSKCAIITPIRSRSKVLHTYPDGSTSYRRYVAGVLFSFPHQYCCPGLTAGVEGPGDYVIKGTFRTRSGKIYRTYKRQGISSSGYMTGSSITIPKHLGYEMVVMASFVIWSSPKQKIFNMPPGGWITGAYIRGSGDTGVVRRVSLG